jgi:fatty-acyl-CoA synthase
MSIESSMMDFPLTIGHIFRHGIQVHGRSSVSTWSPEATRHATFTAVAGRVGQLASLLVRIGIRPGDVVGTLCWNHQEHLEAYFAVPAMGAVLHTINLRLAPDQLAYVIMHAGDRALIVDGSLLRLLVPIASQLSSLRQVIVVGDFDTAIRLGDIEILGAYAVLLGGESPEFRWPDIDERAAAAMCYTSGTTGNPKGVVYSHRSQCLHALSINLASNFALTERDKLLVVVPFFHANAWGMPYAGWWAGCDFLLPQQFLKSEQMVAMIAAERPTFSAAVPTIWNDLLNYEGTDVDLSSLRDVVSGGSAVPRSLINKFHRRFGIYITQGWGMTECSPLAALTRPPKDCPPSEELTYRAKAGRVIAGVELRLVSEGVVQPWDDEAMGEIQLRGPWIAAGYFGDGAVRELSDGWLRTGDIGKVDALGYITLVDRAKDVVKSGGEWISSVAIENALMGHTEVIEAAVIAIEEERWGERPLACVVLAPKASASAADLRDWLSASMPRWWLPERWAFLQQVPRTHVGKFDKKLLRAEYAAGRLAFTLLGSHEVEHGLLDRRSEPKA